MKKRSEAPAVAPATMQSAARTVPKRKPPARLITPAPGIEKVTTAM